MIDKGHDSRPGKDTWDTIEYTIATNVVEGSLTLSAAIRKAAMLHRDLSVDSLLLASVSFCINYDEMLQGNEVYEAIVASRNRYRVISLLSADLTCLPTEPRICDSLIKYWRETKDETFLSLEK